MASPGYSAENRSPGRTYTPSHSSDEDFRLSGLSLEKKYRLFTFRKDGRSWIRYKVSEQLWSDAEIKKVVVRSRKAGRNVNDQLQKMSPPRRNAIEDQIERINHEDGDQWDLHAIHNDSQEVTKRTGEVLAFSLILVRLGAGRQRAGSASQERRRPTIRSSTQDYTIPARRGSQSYYGDRASPAYDNRRQSFRASQTIMEHDPFGSQVLFSKDGKPIQTPGTAALHANGDLPPHIPLNEPIGAMGKDEKEKDKDKQGKGGMKNKKSKGGKDDEVIDLDALLGGDLNDDLLGDHVDHDEQGFFDDDSPIEVMHDNGARGRKKQQAWGGKTPKGRSRSKSRQKSKPRPPSLHIPKDHWRQPPEIMTGGRRRQSMYYGSHGSATTPSIHSNESILEGEVEDYSSSNSSQGYHDEGYDVVYAPARGSKYPRETLYHRRGPPSPQQERYEVLGETGYSRSRPRQERRLTSDNTIARYTYSPHPAQRPPMISHVSAPRFTSTPMSAHGNTPYNWDTGMTPFPSDLTRRRESTQTRDAEHYMRQQQDDHRDREIELLKRERDEAERRAALNLHDGLARRASTTVRTGGNYGGSRYTHEPRQSQRYESQRYGGRDDYHY